MTATPSKSIVNERYLHLAFELSDGKWKLAFSTALPERPRLRDVAAGDLEAVEREIAWAKAKFHLPAQTPVRSCYEAGRDGFWLHRYLTTRGVDNLVVDASSIQVDRRKRRAKTDRLDAGGLLQTLLRHHRGEEDRVWRVVHVPSETDEDARQLHRDLIEMKAQRTQHVNRIKGLLKTRGLAVKVDARFATRLAELRDWRGQPVSEELQGRLRREFERWQLVEQQIRTLEGTRRERIRTGPAAEQQQVRQLLQLSGIGANAAWLFVRELFGWRKPRNRRQVGALAGLVPMPYQSGTSTRDQGISKAGNRRLRTLSVEIAWCWVRYQPRSALTRWFRERFGGGSSRQRRIGIVALARKLLVALWRYLETGEIPEGTELVDWRAKLRGKRVLLPAS